MRVGSVLVVCAGNICRSPTASYLLAEQLQSVRVTSAGLVAKRDMSACSKAIEVAAEKSLDITAHRSTRVSKELVLENDLVLAMEQAHVDDILALAPFCHGKVMLFGKWMGDVDIPDPYRRSKAIYETVFDELKKHARLWATKLEA